jgi:putative hydrolase of the HAD superfamily
MPEVVFFDLVGTLVRGTKPIGEQYAGFARAFGARPDVDKLDAAFRRAMKEGPPLAFTGRTLVETAALERGWWVNLVGRVVEDAGLSEALGGPVFEDFFAALYHHFTTAGAWELFPDVEPALDGLKSRGIRIGLITNYDTRVFAVLEAVGLARYLDAVSIPAHVGASKPAPAIFLHALGQLRVDAREALHVGDEPRDDYEGALAAGLGAVLIDRAGNYRQKGGMRRIESLEELFG